MTTKNSNGNGNSPERRALSPRQAEELFAREAEVLLDATPERAREMLDCGELAGTAADAELRALRYVVEG